MSSYVMRPVTDTSWILQKDGVRLALMIKQDAGFRCMGKMDRTQFKDLEDLAKFLGSTVEIQEPDLEEGGDELATVHGYPTKHQGVVPVEEFEVLPIYKRGKVVHSAGYYGVHFKNGWVTSYCPKLSTLEENEHIGPFRTKLEMLNAISQKKRAIEI